MPRPNVRSFRDYARYQAGEAVWYAQIVTWLPVVSEAIGLGVLLVAFLTGNLHFRRNPTSRAVTVAVAVLFLFLYALAGAWIGARRARGIWLAIALFMWSLVASVISGRVFSFGAAYDVLALILVIRAGREIGVRYLKPGV
jgi:hypothetical protein